MSARFAMRTCEVCNRQVLVTADGRCPHCEAAIEVQAAPRVVEVRLTPSVAQPHVCLQCGEPTHRRTRVRAHGPRPALSPRERADVPWLLHLVTGNIGCLFHIFKVLGELLTDSLASRRPTISLRVRQCAECGLAGRPSVIAPDYDLRRVTFEAHPRYAAALAGLARDVRRQEAVRAVPPRGDDGARPASVVRRKFGCTSRREPAWQERRSESPAHPIGALDGERKADEEDNAWPCHARTTKRPDRPQPRVPDVPMPRNS